METMKVTKANLNPDDRGQNQIPEEQKKSICGQSTRDLLQTKYHKFV